MSSMYGEEHPWLWRCTVASGVTGALFFAMAAFVPDFTSSGGEKAAAISTGIGLMVLCVAALALTSNWHNFGPLEWWKKCIAGSAVLTGIACVVAFIVVIALLWAIGQAAKGAVGGAVGYDD